MLLQFLLTDIIVNNYWFTEFMIFFYFYVIDCYIHVLVGYFTVQSTVQYMLGKNDRFVGHDNFLSLQKSLLPTSASIFVDGQKNQGAHLHKKRVTANEQKQWGTLFESPLRHHRYRN